MCVGDYRYGSSIMMVHPRTEALCTVLDGGCLIFYFMPVFIWNVSNFVLFFFSMNEVRTWSCYDNWIFCLLDGNLRWRHSKECLLLFQLFRILLSFSPTKKKKKKRKKRKETWILYYWVAHYHTITIHWWGWKFCSSSIHFKLLWPFVSQFYFCGSF